MAKLRAVLGYGMAFLLCANGAIAGWLEERTEYIKNHPRPVPRISSPLLTQTDIVRGQKTSDEEIRNFLEQEELPPVSALDVKELDNQPIDETLNRVSYSLRFGDKNFQKQFIFEPNKKIALLKLKDPILSLSIPLAAAIRDIRKNILEDAQPIPDDLQKLYALIIPKIVLQNARYVVGDLKILLPSSVLPSKQMFGKDFATTIGNIIVFSREPDLNDPADMDWWTHQLHHVYQYKNWGIDLFAYRYLKHASRVEWEAKQTSAYVNSYIAQLDQGELNRPQILFTEPLHAASKEISTPLGKTKIFQATNPDNPTGPAYDSTITDQCIINGEHVVVNTNGSVYSLSQGGASIGTRLEGLDRYNCEFDIWTGKNKVRYCVQRDTGYVFPGTPPFHAGQCHKCTSQPCF